MIQRGFRDKLDNYLNSASEFSVEMSVSGGSSCDFCCFGVDESEKLSDDRYMVFYNQCSSPEGEITYAPKGQGAVFAVNTAKLPEFIRKLVFTVSIDGGGNMGNISSHTVRLLQNGQTAAEMVLSGSEFGSEKAIISIEIYKKDVWRFAAVARGFNGGLGDLLRSFGGEEAASAANEAQAAFAPRDIPRSGGSESPSAPSVSRNASASQAANTQTSAQYSTVQTGNIPRAVFGAEEGLPKSTVTQRPSGMPQPIFGHTDR